MKNLTQNFRAGNAVLLSRHDMQNVKGGSAPQLTCTCTSGGGFSPKPGLSDNQIEQLAKHYCGGSDYLCTTRPDMP